MRVIFWLSITIFPMVKYPVFERFYSYIRDHLLFHTCDVTSRDQRNRSVNGGRSSERQIGHFQLRFLTQIDRVRYISWWYHNKGNICKVFPKNDVLRESCPLNNSHHHLTMQFFWRLWLLVRLGFEATTSRSADQCSLTGRRQYTLFFFKSYSSVSERVFSSLVQAKGLLLPPKETY